MECKEAILRRRSVRKFTEESVSEEEIEALLRGAMNAPTACNRKPWEFYVIKEKTVLEALRGAGRFTKMQAPLAIVVCGNQKQTLPMGLGSYWIHDCSAASENILLTAVDLGLGAVWCGVHPQKNVEKNVREILNLPEAHIPLNIIYIGHPAEIPAPKDAYDAAKVHII